MAHPRKLARDAMIAVLIAANTAAGARVYSSRVDPIKKSALPAIAVFSLSEQVDTDDSSETAPRELTRFLKVEVVGWVSGADETAVADAMDDIAEQIEAAIDADPYLVNTAGDSILESTEMEIREGGQSSPLVGIVALTYSVTYRTDQGVTATDDFVSVDATHQLVGGVDDTVPAEDTFTVQES